MNRFAVQASVFALILAASVTGKLLLVAGDVAVDQCGMANELVALLGRRGMTATVSNTLEAPIVAVSKGECRFAIRLLPVSGELDRLTRFDFRGWERIRYQYRGNWFAAVPRGQPYLRYEAARAANRMGWAKTWTPVFAVADNRRCSEPQMDLAEIGANWHRDRRF